MAMKNFLKILFLSLRGDNLLKHLNRVPRILFWHGVDNVANHETEAETFEVKNFKRQIDYLQKNFDIISMDEFNHRFTENSFTNREVVLTFDDGYSNNLHIVAPILSEKSIPFTVFISTEHINKGILFPTSVARLIILGGGLDIITIPTLGIYDLDISTRAKKTDFYQKISKELKTNNLKTAKQIVNDLINNKTDTQFKELVDKYSSVKPMNWNEVKELHKLGATIGSHCKYHICCHENQEPEEVRSQIIESKQIVENKLQVECKYFAYPNGDYTSLSNQFVREAGYRLGFSTNKYSRISSKSDTAIIPRIGVPENLVTFKIFINLYPKR